MNILFVSHYSALTGANRSLLALLDGIKYSEIKPLILIPRKGKIETELKKRNINYLIFPFKNWMSINHYKAPLRFIANILALIVLLRKVKKWNIDLVYTNSSVTPIGVWLAYFLKIPHIWHIREFGWEDYGLKYDFGRLWFEYWLNKSNYIITVSRAVQKRVLRNIKTSNSVIYNGVVKLKFNKKRKIRYLKHEESNKTIFGIIGLLSPSKGQEQAIRAFSKINNKYSNTELWIAGPGSKDYEKFLEKLAIDLHLEETVRFLGYLGDPFKFYDKVDVVLVCSKNEGMGRVTVEAMIAGRPVVGLDNAGTSELIDDGKTGLLYDGSIESLVQKMEYALNNDLTDMVINANTEALEKYSIEKYSQEVKRIIFKTL